MNNKKRILFGIGLFWLALILGFVGVKEYTLRTGTEVLLKLQPVDPRDLFRGDYVILNYDISRFADAGPEEYRVNDTVYANLYVNNLIAASDGISKIKPPEGLFIAGKVTGVTGATVRVEYGIESFFVPEGEGRSIERSMRDMYAKVAIDKSGRAVLKALVQNGVEIR